jgi:UDP-glucose 4-epimerase
MKILVTGGSGFLGSHIADALTEAGHEVTVLDLKRSPYLQDTQDFIKADILDRDRVKEAMKGADAVFHLAALADIDEALDKPFETMKINVLGTANLIEAARDAGVKRFIFASTIYVNSRSGSFYRVSKHSGELLLEEYSRRYGIEHTILRFGTLFGTRANAQNSVYKYLYEAFTTGKIDFYGTGKEVREYIHVSDAARICVDILADKFAGETLILTGHHRMKLSEFLDMINEIMGNRIDIRYLKEESRSHYTQTPYSFIPNVGKKIVKDTYCDLGQSLVEILDRINSDIKEEEIKL